MSAHNSEQRIIAKRLVRCRRCVECLHARRYYWAMAALEQTRLASRTWFGTLTLSDEAQRAFEAQARFKHSSPNAEWWDETRPVTYFCKKRKREVTVNAYICNERFVAMRNELYMEVRRFWARLRKAGHSFKYFLVFEQHKSGQVHMHFLLHEQGRPILKRDLQGQWPHGFTNCQLVGGRSKQSVPPEKAAWYVAKYLSKSEQARQIASKGYRPEKRASRHREAKPNVNSDANERERSDHHTHSKANESELNQHVSVE